MYKAYTAKENENENNLLAGMEKIWGSFETKGGQVQLNMERQAGLETVEAIWIVQKKQKSDHDINGSNAQSRTGILVGIGKYLRQDPLL